MKKSLLQIALETQTNPVSLECYSEKYDRLSLAILTTQLAQLKARQQISLEGFFDFFKKKEKDTKANVSPTEILQIQVAEFEEAIDKLKTEKDSSFSLRTQYFGNAKSANEIISCSKDYLTFLENVETYYDLLIEDFKKSFKLAEQYLKNPEDSTFKQKCIWSFIKSREDSSPFKLFKALKNISKDKNPIFQDKCESMTLTSTYKSRDYQKWTSEDLAQAIFQEFYNVSWIKIEHKETKDISFSKNELVSLFQNLLKCANIILKLENSCGYEKGEIFKLATSTTLNNYKLEDTDIGEFFGFTESYYQGNYTFLFESVLDFSKLFDSVLRIKLK